MRGIVLTVALLAATPSKAQTALETVAFLLLGEDVGQSKSKFVTNGKSLSITDRFETTLVIDQIDACNYKIHGIDFYMDKKTPLEQTVDFSRMSDSYGTFTHQIKPFDGYVSVTVPGVRFCAIQSDPANLYRGGPRPGTCFDTLYTSKRQAGQESRVASALNYFKKTFCKGSAF